MPGILIVDDSLTVRMDLQEAFESAGFTTTLCGTVSAARDAMARGAFSLIVLDVLLPDGDGIELLREIKTAPAAATVPVMLLATEAEVRDRMRGLQTGVDDFVGKPYETASVIARARQLVERAGGQLANHPATLLVIDDSATFRESLTSMLKAAGYTVATAETGEEGLLTAVALRPHAIIVDGTLPGGMDGATVIRRLKQDVALRHTPCLLLTASEEREDELRAFEAGADGYLRKEADANVLLARIAAALRSASSPSLATFNSSSLLGRKKILAVDDSVTYLNAVSDELRAEGYDVILALSGQEALEVLAVQPVDCILLDVLMPGLSGHETCCRIKGTSTWKEIPLLMLTSLDERQAMVAGLNAGADDYIPKSGDFEVLRVRLRALLRRKQYEDENRRVRQELLTKELESTQARAAQEIAEARAALTGELERKNQELEGANRAKTVFLSTMSHEIRTPMNAILGYAQLMLRDPSLGTEAKANLKIIGRSGEHLMTLINDVLDMSKIEAGRTEINPVTFNLSTLLNDLAAMFRLRAETKGLRFEMVVDGEAVPYIVADEGKLRQALINLLGNAVKFTRSGQVKLGVTLHQRNADGLWLSARVEDTGVGITDEEQQKLFEPFTQARRGREVQKGTGLGLAITRSYARLMGGDVTVSSSPGKGSIFHFEIPVARGDSGIAVKRNGPRRVIGLRAGTNVPGVLIVDDQIDNRDWLMKLLTSIGFSVRGAEDGEAAIRNWKEWNPALILMDVHMPVMDGLEATRIIKADPRGKETAILVLTASAMDENRRTVAQSGADDFLSKPCREDELLEKMRALLNIVYDYEEMSGAEGEAPDGVKALNAAGLGQLPPALVEELRNAIFSGNIRRLNELILNVRETADAGSANALQELADKYEYDALAQLLEQECRP